MADGSTGIMGFQFLCKMKKSWNGNDCPRYRQKIFGNILPQAVLVKDTLFKDSEKN